MKNRILLLVIIIQTICVLTQKSYSQPNKQFSELETTILKATGEIVKLFSEDPNVIWQGYDLSKQPFVVYIPDKWVLIVNCNKKINGLNNYPEDWPKLYTDAAIYYGSYKDLTGQLQFNYEIDSIKTVVVGFPEDFYPEINEETKINILGFIVHEVFHQYQRDFFGEIPWSREEKYPILDADNTASAVIEMQLLTDALYAMDNNNTSKCQKSLISFSEIRQNRWKNTNTFVKKYEQGQEINEGTAKYVEVKSILEMNKRAQAEEPNIDKYFLKAFKSNGISYLLNEFKNNIDGNTISPENMIRNRIYPVGAEQGILMDYLGINWKSKAQKHTLLTKVL